MTPLQKRLDELRYLAVNTLAWCSPDTETAHCARALLALLPVVKAADDYHHVRNKWGDVIDQMKRCERALTETEKKGSP